MSIAFQDGFPGEKSDWAFNGRETDISVRDTEVVFDGSTETPEDPPRGSAYRLIKLEEGRANNRLFVKVAGELRVMRTSSGVNPERNAAFLIWFKDDHGTAFDYRTVGRLGESARDRTVFKRTVAVPRQARWLVLAVVGRDSNGAFALRDASVERYTLATHYLVIRWSLLTAWATVVGTILWWSFRRSPGVIALAVAMPLGFTFVGILAPESLNAPLMKLVEDWLSPLMGSGPLLPAELVFKGGHFVAFFTLASASLALRKRLHVSRLSLFSTLGLLALGTEGMQLHLADRTTRASDIAIDLIAVICAIVVVSFIERVTRTTTLSSP